MEKAGPTSWPPLSPYLTPCDYYLQRYLKYIVYQEPPPNVILELEIKVTKAVVIVDEDTLNNVCKNMENSSCVVLREVVVISKIFWTETNLLSLRVIYIIQHPKPSKTLRSIAFKFHDLFIDTLYHYTLGAGTRHSKTVVLQVKPIWIFLCKKWLNHILYK